MAIEEAEQGIRNNFLLFDNGGDNGISKNDLMTIDEELKLINGTNGNGLNHDNKQDAKKCLQVPKLTINDNDESILNDPEPSNTQNGIEAKSTSTPNGVKTKRSSATIATANLSNMAKANRNAPSELRIQRAKLSRLTTDEFATYFEETKRKV